MALHNTLTDRQPYAGARVGRSAMQTLKDLKDAFPKFRVKADPVITD
jgi:hypothetical protein